VFLFLISALFFFLLIAVVAVTVWSGVLGAVSGWQVVKVEQKMIVAIIDRRWLNNLYFSCLKFDNTIISIARFIFTLHLNILLFYYNKIFYLKIIITG